MGGMVNLAQRTSEGIKKSCKVGTWFLPKLGSMDLLDEKFFNEFAKKHDLFKEDIEEQQKTIVHNDYESNYAMFAPYHYGILLIDFKDKKVFSCNDYNGFLNFGINNLISDYEEIGRVKQTSGEMVYSNGEVIKESFYEDNHFRLPSIRFIESCIRNKGQLFLDGKQFPIEENDDYFTIAAKMYGKDLSTLSEEEEDKYKKERRKNKPATQYYSLEEYTNIDIKKQGWDIYNGDGNIESIQFALDYYIKINALSETEIQLWKDYIVEKKRYKTKENEE